MAIDNRDRQEIDENKFLLLCLQAGFCHYQERFLTAMLQALYESIEPVNYAYQSARKDGMFEPIPADGDGQSSNTSRTQHPQAVFLNAARSARERSR